LIDEIVSLEDTLPRHEENVNWDSSNDVRRSTRERRVKLVHPIFGFFSLRLKSQPMEPVFLTLANKLIGSAWQFSEVIESACSKHFELSSSSIVPHIVNGLTLRVTMRCGKPVCGISCLRSGVVVNSDFVDS